MLTLELKEEELKEINYNKEAIKNLLVSRAIYNESYNHEFTEEEKLQIKYLEKSEAINFYMRKTVEPRVMVNENTIIERYNENKDYFNANNISFTDAREIIKSQLNAEVNYGLEQDLIKTLVHNMGENVTLNKEDILFTKGDANLIKSVLLFELLKQEAEKTNFFEKNEKELDILYKEVRIKFFVQSICSKEIEITQEEVSKFYVDNTKKFENISLEQAYNDIANYLFYEKLNVKTAEYIQKVSEKYFIDKEVEKYTSGVIN